MPIPVLVEKAKQAIVQEDEKGFEDFMTRVFELVTGFKTPFTGIPEGVSEALYIERMCEYDKVQDQIVTPEMLEEERHQIFLTAYSTVQNGFEDSAIMRGVRECIHEDGRRTRSAQMLRDGIAWAKKLKAATAKQALRMAQEVEALAAKNPQNAELATLTKLAHLDAENKKKAERSNFATVARNDQEARRKIFDELFVLRTGLDAWLELVPNSHLVEKENKRKCDNHESIAPLHAPEEIETFRHLVRLGAHILIQQGKANAETVRIRTECLRDNGEPEPESKALREGLSWAKNFQGASVEELRTIRREYENLHEQHPDNVIYDLLISLIDGKIKDIHREKERQEFKKKYPEGILFKGNLVNKAHKGDLAAQLEVARRIETGNNFRQDNAMAYFWYKRARQNGGGQFAQSGMDRLFPHLTVGDFLSIDIWTEEGHRPY